MLNSQPNIPPLIKELSENMKIPLDTITKLQDMEVLDKKPPFPTIVVLGESCAGTSVIGTLLGLNLPTALPFPIALNFKLDTDLPCRKIWFEFRFKDISHYEKQVSETRLANKISKLVEPVPEDKRSSIEITLTIIQPQVSDLMVTLLPEIQTRHNKDEEKREMELLQGYIDKYTRDNECLFLNVLSCSSNFNSCLSRRVLKGLGYIGARTITVFTKVDLSDEYLITQLTSKNVEAPSPFGYFFVYDTINDDDDEKTEEFALLSEVYKDCIGFDVISKNLVTAMLSILFNHSSLILKRIEADLKESDLEIKRSQKTFDSLSDAIPVILSIVNSAKCSIHKLFISKEYGEHEKDEYMHAASNMALRYTRFKTDLHDLKLDNTMPFLQFEIELLSSRNWPTPLNFVSSSIIQPLLNRQILYASSTIDKFVSSIMGYIEGVVVKIFLNDENYNWQLHMFMKRIGRVLLEGVQKSFEKKLKETLDLEKKFLYTCSDNFSRKMNEMKSIKLELDVGEDFTSIEGLGNNIRVDHLKCYRENHIKIAFELKKQIVVYWQFVVNRFVDNCALNLQALINEMITVGIEEVVIREELMTRTENENKLPNVAPMVAYNKANLERRVTYLKKIKKDIEKWQVSFEFFR